MSPLAKPETKKAQRERERLVSDLTEAQRAFDLLSASEKRAIVDALHAEQAALEADSAQRDLSLLYRHYWRDPAKLEAAAALARTPYRDARPGQTWEVRVSGRLAFVVLEWVGTRDSRFVKVNRKKFRGTNSATGRQVDGDLARLRRRVA